MMGLWAWVKNNKDSISAITSMILAFAAIVSILYAKRSNDRSEKLFSYQVKPVVQVKPIQFRDYNCYDKAHLMGTTVLQVTNHGGYTAKDVRVDVCYVENVWIREWIVAAVEGLDAKDKKNLLTEDEKRQLINYKRVLQTNTMDLAPKEPKIIGWRGNIDTCENKDKINEKTISVRTRWKDDTGYEYDYIDKYKLIITRAHGGESFAVVPLESHK